MFVGYRPSFLERRLMVPSPTSEFFPPREVGVEEDGDDNVVGAGAGAGAVAAG